MAVNTGAKQFRKVDVDQYDEERFVEDAADDNSVVGPNDGEVNTLLAQYPFPQLLLSSDFLGVRIMFLASFSPIPCIHDDCHAYEGKQML